ncbi:DinB family protein [Solitalea canadensis]|uniref:Uncharacterized protein n=1 Tax=Solitalea canadensis (strain ATCC 29591 / DSM 3403 / JCM 21819 / LMG 8368 / NBRC 15130 / NCIMB 12057 / USAM 9D) TaxID=929556 RepID=H8KUR9_SOLCM|nr:DinB family protein [Solitalea canadensis]AFD07553.1 hypothetical protein Solca_2518 [Solitalea canadensis DSM 3403]
MNISFKTVIWQQLGAAIDMLENAISMCPETVWDDESQFWYIAYHCIFYLDYYSTEEPQYFSPPEPYTLSEFDPEGAMPERVYSKQELLDYLHYGRQKGRQLISGLTDEIAAKRFVNEYRDYSILEVILYNMRHIQHHTAQLNLLLRQKIDDAPKWVSVAKDALL